MLDLDNLLFRCAIFIPGLPEIMSGNVDGLELRIGLMGSTVYLFSWFIASM